MPVTLLRRYTQIDTLVLDANLSEDHQSEVDVTEHPVEDGSNIADHRRVKPEVVTIEGVISETPMGERSTPRSVAAARPGVDTALAQLKQLAPGGILGDSDYALQKLLDMKNSGVLVTVMTPVRVYTNMICTSLRLKRDGKTGDCLPFTASFKEVRLVQVRRAQVTLSREPKANKQVKDGKKGAEEKDFSATLFRNQDAIKAKAKEFFGLDLNFRGPGR